MLLVAGLGLSLLDPCDTSLFGSPHRVSIFHAGFPAEIHNEQTTGSLDGLLFVLLGRLQRTDDSLDLGCGVGSEWANFYPHNFLLVCHHRFEVASQTPELGLLARLFRDPLT